VCTVHLQTSARPLRLVLPELAHSTRNVTIPHHTIFEPVIDPPARADRHCEARCKLNSLVKVRAALQLAQLQPSIIRGGCHWSPHCMWCACVVALAHNHNNRGATGCVCRGNGWAVQQAVLQTHMHACATTDCDRMSLNMHELKLLPVFFGDLALAVSTFNQSKRILPCTHQSSYNPRPCTRHPCSQPQRVLCVCN
jgi:hypothetical protein